MKALLDWTKMHCPELQCAALTVTSRQRDLVLDWGADIAIHRANLASHLREILECRSNSAAVVE